MGSSLQLLHLFYADDAVFIALLFKWVWRFRTQRSSLWARVIKEIHGEDGKLGKNVKHSHPSIWLDIVREMEQLKNHGLVPRALGEYNVVPIKVNVHAWKV
ncbi:hypothetical protein Tco_0359924, partial [Tanacetum coccineum]